MEPSRKTIRIRHGVQGAGRARACATSPARAVPIHLRPTGHAPGTERRPQTQRAVATLLAIIVLSTGSTTLATLAAGAAALRGLVVGGRSAAVLAAACCFVAVPILGAALSLLDWPLRLLVVPGLVATLGTQATPDGRLAHRYAASWVSVRLAGWRSLGCTLPGAGRARPVRGDVWVAPDERDRRLRRCRVGGPAMLELRRPVLVRRRRFPRAGSWHAGHESAQVASG